MAFVIARADRAIWTRREKASNGTPIFTNHHSYSNWQGLTTGFELEDLPAPPPAPSMLWSWSYRYNAMGEREQKQETGNPVGAATLPGYSWTYYLLNGTKEQLSVWKGAVIGEM